MSNFIIRIFITSIKHCLNYNDHHDYNTKIVMIATEPFDHVNQNLNNDQIKIMTKVVMIATVRMPGRRHSSSSLLVLALAAAGLL